MQHSLLLTKHQAAEAHNRSTCVAASLRRYLFSYLFTTAIGKAFNAVSASHKIRYFFCRIPYLFENRDRRLRQSLLNGRVHAVAALSRRVRVSFHLLYWLLIFHSSLAAAIAVRGRLRRAFFSRSFLPCLGQNKKTLTSTTQKTKTKKHNGQPFPVAKSRRRKRFRGSAFCSGKRTERIGCGQQRSRFFLAPRLKSVRK